MKKLFVVLILMALTFGFGLWLFLENSKTQSTRRSVIVVLGTLEDVTTAQGTLEPKNYVDVGLQVSGQITKLHVDVSDSVKQGQLLAEIDPRIYASRVAEDAAQVKSLHAQVLQQQATLDLAISQHARNTAMYAQKAISKDTLDQSQAALKVAQAKVISLQAQEDQAASMLESDKTNLGFTKIYAPMDGVVASLPIREGQTINSVQSAPTLMRLANLDVMTVRAQVAEADIARLTLGMSAYFTTLGDMERRWKGTVRQIQPSPEIINDVVLYNVLIDVKNPQRILMDGMSAQVFFEIAKASDVPIVPLEALGKRLPKEDTIGKAYAVRVAGKQRTVQIGLTDRTQAEIKDGLAMGDVVEIPDRTKPGSSRGGGGIPPGMTGPRL